MSFTGSGSPGSSPYMACSHSCEMDCLEERHQGSKESYNEREKTALRCMRAEIELSQPQLYGTHRIFWVESHLQAYVSRFSGRGATLSQAVNRDGIKG